LPTLAHDGRRGASISGVLATFPFVTKLVRKPPTEGEPSSERKLPTEGTAERLAPWTFVVIGVAMMAVAAADYLATSVATAFVVLGAGLVALGGLAARAEGTLKLGVQGVEMFLRARDALVEVKQEVEERDPEEAERLAGKVEELDEWFAEYLRDVAANRVTNPWTRAAMLDKARRHKRPLSEGGSTDADN
jgi:hypothetical protein